MPENSIEIARLTKSFGSTEVLRGIDLTVPTGTVCALLGPNGAGKTTVVNIASTLLPADGGTVRVAGHDVAADGSAVRAAIGVTGQFSAVDNLLSGTENLRLMADLRRLGRTEATRRVDELIDMFGLREAAGRPVAGYSGGMKRKLDLAMTLVARPQVLFLDEPTTGLDPRSRRDLWDVVRALVDDGVTILLTTQYLDEADRLADRVAVLDGGRIVAHDEPARLKQQVPGGRIRLRFADPGGLADARLVLSGAVAGLADLTEPAGVANSAGTAGTAGTADSAGAADPAGTTLQIELPPTGAVATLRTVLDRLDDRAIPVEDIQVTAPDLDDVFLALTSGSTRKALS